MARVVHLFRAPKRREPMEELQEARVMEDVGLQGCAHARPQGRRQVLLMDRETLDDFELAPGIVRENVTTEGLDVNGLEIGQRLQIGEAELQVSAVCDPCEQIEALRPGLQAAMQGKRGMLCRVVRGGLLRRGAEIVVIQMVGR
ncbi:MAG TPA: MOSC domain-containing protein [Candidatus Acidoferrales bacterium]|jgi:MOSC domain-containing protein YiiM|nr:MOSC domain-containing protein [Candidatus Acidoferrales bacterium]